MPGQAVRASRRLLLAFAVIAALVSGAPGVALADNLEGLDIASASGRHHFNVEVMRSPAELERGLMFRRSMPPERGMLFDFKTDQPLTFWMKNTYLPLDMIFIAHDGRVVGIKTDAEPLSERLIPSGAPASGVLEVNAGTAARLGLKAGDSVSASIFKR